MTRSYVTNLRKGRIENPGYEKLLAIARAMGFPPALWFEDGDLPVPERGEDLASRVAHLFETTRGTRRQGSPTRTPTLLASSPLIRAVLGSADRTDHHPGDPSS